MITVDECIRRSKQKIDTLVTELRGYAEQHIRLSHAAGIPIQVTHGFRSYAEQDAIYAQGRTKPGSKVTNARGGQSVHNFRLAYDIVVLTDSGNADWGSTAKYDRVGQIGKSLGLEWGGDFKSITDRPHFQITQGLTTAQLRAGLRPTIREVKTMTNEPTIQKASVYVDKTRIDAVVVDGRVYVQMRDFSDSLNVGFTYDAKTKTGRAWTPKTSNRTGTITRRG